MAVDLLVKREPFFQAAQEFFTLVEEGRVVGGVSVLAFDNIHHLVRKLNGAPGARRAVQEFRAMVQVLAVDEKIIDRALASNFPDFEDAVQYHTALEYGMEAVVTRNLRDFKRSKIPVLTPSDLLSAF